MLLLLYRLITSMSVLTPVQDKQRHPSQCRAKPTKSLYIMYHLLMPERYTTLRYDTNRETDYMGYLCANADTARYCKRQVICIYIILKIYYIDCYYVICTRTTCYNAICYIDTQIVVASVGCLLRHSDIS